MGLLAGFLAGLSYGTRYFRFGQGDFDLDEAGLRALCAPSPVHGVSYAAMLDGDAGAGMVAFGGYCIEAGGEGCELALVVADAWQGHGMGRRLVAKLAEDARQRGLQHMCARILVSNQRMLDCARGLGFRIEPWEGSRVVMRAAMVLQPREAAVRCSSA